MKNEKKVVKKVAVKVVAKVKPYAVLTINKAGALKLDERKVIAEWLRAQAKSFVSKGETYNKNRFTARCSK